MWNDSSAMRSLIALGELITQTARLDDGLALIGHLESRHLLFLEPLAHGFNEVLRLGQIDGFGSSAGSGCQFLCGGVGRQEAFNVFV